MKGIDPRIEAKFGMEPPCEVGKKVHINGSDHMTKMVAMLIYSKKYSTIFYRTNSPMNKTVHGAVCTQALHFI